MTAPMPEIVVSAPAAEIARAGLGGEEGVWIVGGAVRDTVARRGDRG